MFLGKNVLFFFRENRKMALSYNVIIFLSFSVFELDFMPIEDICMAYFPFFRYEIFILFRL